MPLLTDENRILFGFPVSNYIGTSLSDREHGPLCQAMIRLVGGSHLKDAAFAGGSVRHSSGQVAEVRQERRRAGGADRGWRPGVPGDEDHTCRNGSGRPSRGDASRRGSAPRLQPAGVSVLLPPSDERRSVRRAGPRCPVVGLHVTVAAGGRHRAEGAADLHVTWSRAGSTCPADRLNANRRTPGRC